MLRQNESAQICSREKPHSYNPTQLKRMNGVLLRIQSILLFLLTAASIAGCNRVQSISGGTEGTLQFGEQVLSDIQVNVHQEEGSAFKLIGFGVTDREGCFELVTPGAKGALWLTPGRYHFTLESAGAPIQIPGEFTMPETTPFKVTWSKEESELELKTDNPLPLP